VQNTPFGSALKTPDGALTDQRPDRRARFAFRADAFFVVAFRTTVLFFTDRRAAALRGGAFITAAFRGAVRSAGFRFTSFVVEVRAGRWIRMPRLNSAWSFSVRSA